MAQYEYQPLDFSTNQIRLLRLRKGYHTDAIECEIFETYLSESECIPYEALSYTWSYTSEPEEIKLNGYATWVSWNLYMALSCLRLSDRDRLLWVDALCIDQSCDQERGHQVGHMREIYQNAEQVLIWLGRAGDEVDLLMDLMTQLERRAMLQSSYRKQSPDSWRAVWPAMVEEQGGINSQIYVRRRNAMLELLRRPWFQRIWVLQEAASARRALIVCGWRSISSRTFALMPSLMDIEPDAHSKAVLEIMPGHLRKSSWWSEKPTLEILLWKFKSSNASDARDRVYALLGISSDACQQAIFPANYELRLGKMVQHTISYLLFKKLHDPSLHGLPEWNLDEVFALLDTPDLLAIAVFRWALLKPDYVLAIKILDLVGFNVNQNGTSVRAPLLLLVNGGGHEPVLRHLLARDELDVNVQVEEYTPLHLAVRSGLSNVVNALLERQDIRLDTTDSDGLAPLTTAADKGHVEIARSLLDRGADVNGNINESRTTPLWAASKQSHVEVVRLLLERGAKPDAKDGRSGTSPLWIASDIGNTEVMTLLLDAGADIESKQLPLRVTPLATAVGNEHWAAVDLLLNRGSDPFALHTDGEMIVHKAANSGKLEFLQILHHRNTPMDTEGRTPLHAAARHGRVREVEFLLSIGADTNRKNMYNQTPLMEAVAFSTPIIVRILAGKGAKVDAVEDCDRTPLMVASLLGKSDMVRVLLELGANPNSQDVYGKTALMLITGSVPSTEKRRGVDVVAETAGLLLEFGAEVDSQDLQGRTALSWASERGLLSLIRVLLRYGADKTIEDCFGRLPLSYSLGK